MYYVYSLSNEVGKVFYVGKGIGNRMFRHETYVKQGKIPNGNKHLFFTIKDILDRGEKIVYTKLYETADESDAYGKEIEYITEYGVDNLCNLTYGGDGMRATDEVKQKISNAHTGKIVLEKTKDKLRVINKNRFSDPLERKKTSDAVRCAMTEEVRDKIRKSKLGKAPPNKGKSKKISSVCKGCGKEILIYPTSKRKYCSIKCRSVETVCAFCGTQKFVGPSAVRKSKNHFCNKFCQAKYITGPNHPKVRGKNVTTVGEK